LASLPAGDPGCMTAMGNSAMIRVMSYNICNALGITAAGLPLIATLAL